jgi:hypothetical protein
MTSAVVAALVLGAVAASPGSGALGNDGPDQHSLLLDRRVLPSATVRAGSPPTGAFFTPTNRTDAANNGVVDNAPGDAYLANQPVQGFSAMVPAGNDTWWALTDNGFGARENSTDYQLAIYHVAPSFGQGAPRVLGTTLLSDPDRHVPWQIVCDQTGDPLPDLSINVLPVVPPPACGDDPAARLLTGFDFDPESLQVAADGTFWLGEEFGPFLLHVDADGRLLEPPIATPGVKAPQNPTLDVAGGEEPNVATSRGFEGMAISPDRRTLYPLLEGAVGDDSAQDVLMFTFDIRRRAWRGATTLRLEMPGAKVNLTLLRRSDGSPAYPNAAVPTGTGGQAHGELTAINRHQFLFLERDGAGDGVAAPRFKKLFLIDTRRGEVTKQLLADLMAIPDPMRVGGDGDYFRFPFVTIESVHPVDEHTVLVASDNNFPLSNGRSRSLTNERTGPLFADDNEMILIHLGSPLDVDKRLLSPPR